MHGYSNFLFGYQEHLLSSANISKFQFDLESEDHKFISLGLLRATLVKQRLFLRIVLNHSKIPVLVRTTHRKPEYLEMRKTYTY